MKKITAVIVNYNKSALLVKCLSCIKKMTVKPDHIIVVDNHSSDDSVILIKKEFPDVELIENNCNAGGAEGFNTGIRKALKTSCDFIYLMDNDIEPEANALQTLYDALIEDSSAAAAGSKGFFCNPENHVWQAGCDFNWLLQIKIHRGERKPDTGEYEKTEYVSYMPAFSLLVRRAAVEQIGLMDKRFYIYMDDADWCFRMRKRGWNILYVPQSRVFHHVSSGIPSPFSIYYATRNFLLLFKKHCHPSVLPFMYAASLCKNLVKLCVYFRWRLKLRTGDYKKTVYAFFYAYLDFFAGRFGRNDFF